MCAETTAYFDAIVAARAIELTEEQALAGNTTLSLETTDLATDQDIFSFIHNNFPSFLRYIRYLNAEDQELLLSYYLLLRTQNVLALIYKTTQTVTSFRLRMCVKNLCAHILCGGKPPVEWLCRVLTKAKWEKRLSVPLSQLIVEYAECRDFKLLAIKYHLHQPDIRRTMSQMSKAFLVSKDPEEQACGAYTFTLIDKASPDAGLSKRKQAKMGAVYVGLPKIVGQFRVSMADPDLEERFASHANA